MASIREEIQIDVAPEQVWAAVRDAGAVHTRLVPGYALDARIEGDERILTVPGGEVRELIVAIDDTAQRLAYAVIAGRMPLRHHHASFQVFPRDGGHSLLVWITDILPDALAPEVRARMARGGEVMKATIEAAVTHPAGENRR